MSSLAVRAAVPPATPSATQVITHWDVVSAKSCVTFSAAHWLLWTLRGVFHGVRGVVRLVEAEPRFTHVDVRIPTASLTTGSVRRDRWLLSPELLDAGVYKEIIFLGHWLRGDPRDEFALDGQLRLRGVPREISFRARAGERHVDPTTGIEQVRYHATTVLDRRDFGIVARAPHDLGGAVLGDTLRVALDVTLSRAVTGA